MLDEITLLTAISLSRFSFILCNNTGRVSCSFCEKQWEGLRFSANAEFLFDFRELVEILAQEILQKPFPITYHVK